MDENRIEADVASGRLRGFLARRPERRTLLVIAIGCVGVLVAENAAGSAPVALPLLFATGLLGAMVRPGWGGPGATWIGGAIAEAASGVVYVVSRPAGDAYLDSLVPLYFVIGIALFAGVFCAAAGTAAGVRRLASPRTAGVVLRVAVVAILAASLLAIVATPPSPTGGEAAPGAASNRWSAAGDPEIIGVRDGHGYRHFLLRRLLDG